MQRDANVVSTIFGAGKAGAFGVRREAAERAPLMRVPLAIAAAFAMRKARNEEESPEKQDSDLL